ncbi:MAG: hypothetical protein CUN57_00455, partial [Phototrophicales bacterium]
AFTETGGSLFPRITQTESKEWTTLGYGEQGLRNHPQPDYEYTLGADFAGGTGNDYSAINVLCLNTREQVYRFMDNRINPVAFAEKLVEVARRYNDAYVVPEINSHGIAGTELIRRNYPLTRIYRRSRSKSQSSRIMPAHGYGWQTMGTTKPYMVGIAQQFILNGWTVYDSMTYSQLRSFKEDPDTGKMEADTGHDDVAIAFMLACLGILRLLRMTSPEDVTPDELPVAVAERLAKLRGKALKKPAPKMSHRDAQGR